MFKYLNMMDEENIDKLNNSEELSKGNINGLPVSLTDFFKYKIGPQNSNTSDKNEISENTKKNINNNENDIISNG